jgi:hypothetical protein
MKKVERLPPAQSAGNQNALLQPNFHDTGEQGSMPFCVELDNIKDTGVPVHPPAVSPVAAG